jgi:hypothetical protein
VEREQRGTSALRADDLDGVRDVMASGRAPSAQASRERRGGGEGVSRTARDT